MWARGGWGGVGSEGLTGLVEVAAGSARGALRKLTVRVLLLKGSILAHLKLNIK